jgi:hypothetical protein
VLTPETISGSASRAALRQTGLDKARWRVPVEFVFHGATVSREVLTQLKRVQQNAARECMELIEQDRSAPQARSGAAFVLALRPWRYSGFAQFERQWTAQRPQ